MPPEKTPAVKLKQVCYGTIGFIGECFVYIVCNISRGSRVKITAIAAVMVVTPLIK